MPTVNPAATRKAFKPRQSDLATPLLRLVACGQPVADACEASMPKRKRARTDTSTADNPLRAILDWRRAGSKQKPVEQLCHAATSHRALSVTQRVERGCLEYLGLGVEHAIGSLPDAIVLTNKRRFRQQCPELAHLVKLFESGGGVVPYGPGYARHDCRARVGKVTQLHTGSPLLSVLRAELKPGWTVEQVWYACLTGDIPTTGDEDSELMEICEFCHLLPRAGLVPFNSHPEDGPEADGLAGVELLNETKFCQVFPELAHLAPTLRECDGVVGHSGGRPRTNSKSGPLPTRSKGELFLAWSNPAEE